MKKLLLTALIFMSLPTLGMQGFNRTLKALTETKKKSDISRFKDDLIGEYWGLSESDQENAREKLLENGIDIEGIVSKSDIAQYQAGQKSAKEEMEWEQVPEQATIRSDEIAPQLEKFLSEAAALERENTQLTQRLEVLKVIAKHNKKLQEENSLLLARKQDLDQQIARKKMALEQNVQQTSSSRATMLLQNANNNLYNQINELEQRKEELLKRLNS